VYRSIPEKCAAAIFWVTLGTADALNCAARSAQESTLKTEAVRFPNFWQAQYYTALEPHRGPPDQQLL